MIYPTEDELRYRITKHLKHRPENMAVALLWAGYIGGLLEWGLITPETHRRLYALLPKVGAEELTEIFLGSGHEEHKAISEE